MLCHATRIGNRIVASACREVDAVFDTGAPKSVLHPRVAPIAYFPRGAPEPVRGAGGHARLPTTTAFLQAPGCSRIYVAPWIDKNLPEAFAVDVIVGDDYMEAAYMHARPAERPPDARCTPT